MLDRLNALLADRYSVERELGRGGMASVWLARDLAHGRPVALKVLHPELAGAIGVDRRTAVALEQGNFDRARAAYEAAQRLSTDIEIPNAVAGIAMADAGAGDTAGAREALDEAEALAAPYTPPVSHTVVYLAQAHAALGETGPAVAWLRRYPIRRNVHFQLHLRCDPPFDPIADDPGFRSLLLVPRPAQRGGC